MDIRQRVEFYTDAIIRDIQDLIAIKSVEDVPQPGMPFGEGCAKALNAALQKGETLGFRSKNLDNYAGYLEIGEGKDLIGILTHVDVVPEGDISHWVYDPYGRNFVDGKIYGRGADDNKGPTILSMYAMKIIQDMNIPLKKRIRHIIGANEETGFHCMEHYNQVEEPITMGFSPDAKFPVIFAESGAYGLEATAPVNGNDGIKITSIHGGHAHNIVADNCFVTLKGTLEQLEQVETSFCSYSKAHQMNYDISHQDGTLSLTLHGIAVHASLPWNGINAISYMMDFLHPFFPTSPLIRGYNKLIGTDVLGSKCGIQCEDKYGKLSFCNGSLAYDIATDQATISIDIRFPVTIDFNRDYAGILIENFENEGFSTVHTGTDKAVYVDPTSDFIQALHSAYVEVTGDYENLPCHSGGGTYAKAFSNCVAYGIAFPGVPEVAHLADEFLSVESIQKSTEIFVRALLKLLDI